MYRKCLIMVGTILLCMSTLYAHPNWGVTVMNNAYDWSEKRTSVEVWIEIVEWADLSLAEGESGILLLEEVGVLEYSGCIWLEVLNNFPDLRIVAELTPHMDADWSVAFNSGPGMTDITAPDPQHAIVKVDNVNMNLPSPAPLQLCVTMENPLWGTKDPDDDTLAEVTFTLLIADSGNHPAHAPTPVIDVQFGAE
mgnify:CR=1 FL=1